MPNKQRYNTSQVSKRASWIGGLLVILLYTICIIACYQYCISDSNPRWRAHFGKQELPDGYSIHGIDVSHYQGNINWSKVAHSALAEDSRLSFVMIKATEGENIIDEYFNENFYQAKKQGLIRGAYHFFSPKTSGKAQAHYYLRQVHLEDGDLPPILDIETIGGLSRTELRYQVMEWLEIVEATYGVAPIIYTNYSFKQQYLNGETFDRYPYWIAHYYVKDVQYKGQWKFWQHTDCGRLDGIKGDVDLDIYNGSMYDLQKLCISAELNQEGD